MRGDTSATLWTKDPTICWHILDALQASTQVQKTVHNSVWEGKEGSLQQLGNTQCDKSMIILTFSIFDKNSQKLPIFE